MGTIRQLIKDLNKASGKMRRAAQVALEAEVPSLIQDLKKQSPVDTGEYKQSWRKVKARFSDTNILASVGIVNVDPKAPLMEFGADPETAPWYFPNAKKPSGKLKEFDGRIWAGGLNPGHSFTVGGAIGPVIMNNEERQLRIANSVANHMIKVI